MRQALWIFALITTLIVAWLIIPTCQAENAAINQSTQAQNAKAANYKCTTNGAFALRKVVDIAHDRDKEITALSTFSIALFTVILAVASALQFRALMSSISLARDEFISTHRPKIRIKHVRIKNGTRAREPLTVRLVIVNAGIGEAQIASCGIAYSFIAAGDSLPPEDTVNFTTYVAAIPPVPSGFTWVFEFTSLESLTDYGSRSIGSGNVKLYCLGSLDYRDKDGRIRKTAFCRYLDISIVEPGQGFWRLLPDEKPNRDYEYED
jgi:hypothetical protein